MLGRLLVEGKVVEKLELCDLICNRILLTPATIRTQSNGNCLYAIVHHDAQLQYLDQQFNSVQALHKAATQKTVTEDVAWHAWQYHPHQDLE